MTKLLSRAFLALLLIYASCKPEEIIRSNEASLYSLTIDYRKSTFDTQINDTEVNLTRLLPFGVESISIKSISLPIGATVDKLGGDILQLSQSPITITVTAEDGLTQAIYHLHLETSTEASSIVEKHGLLEVSGNKIVNRNNEAVSFAGNSFFWSNNNWGGLAFYQAPVVEWLKLDWETTIVRAAMGVEDDGGYLDSQNANKNRIIAVVDAAIAEGIYVIIDWHSHHAEDHTQEAVQFFEEMAILYGSYDNVIYEIYNEPLNVSWSGAIKPYAETVIAAIRAIDPDNMIIVGTPEWSQRVDLAAADPITSSPNIAYTLHFYTVHHQQWLRDRATAALNSGIALFITEWGSLGYTQNDPETELWITWCKQHQISNCNWVINDKEEEWSILTPGASSNGGWPDNNLTDAGKLTRKIIRDWSE